MFLLKMVCISMAINHFIHSSLIESHQIMVIHCFNWCLFIESGELVKQIIPHTIHLSVNCFDDNPLALSNNNDISYLNDKTWSSITVNERMFMKMNDALILSDFSRVQFIYIHEDAFWSIPSLTISNIPELKVLVMENNSFYSTNKLTIKSNSNWFKFNNSIFLI